MKKIVNFFKNIHEKFLWYMVLYAASKLINYHSKFSLSIEKIDGAEPKTLTVSYKNQDGTWTEPKSLLKK